MKFLIETGNESHTTSWQRFQVGYANGENAGKHLYQVKSTILSQEWITQTKHETVVKTVYELPNGTKIHLNYASFQGKISQIIQLDETAEVQEIEVSNCRLRSYTVKGRFVVLRDLIAEKAASLKASQQEGF